MATSLAAREVLVLATEKDCMGRSNSENREGIDDAIRAYRGKTRFNTEGFEDFGAIMGKAILGDQDLVAPIPRMNYRKKTT